MKSGIVRDHGRDAVHLAASLKAGTVAPSAMLRKLAAYRRQNQLDLALQEQGRIDRTLFMLDWLESPALRRRCYAGLNKSEQRHFLAQEICTFSPHLRSRPRSAAIQGIGIEPRDRGDRLLEFDLHD